MEFHEAANIFPLDEEHIDELAKDIEEHGQRIPVELIDGKVVDGRRRTLACQKLGIEPDTREIEVDDPIAYVLSLNLHRRHLTPSQRSNVGFRAKRLYTEQAKERQRASGGDRKSGKSVPVKLPEPIRGDARDMAGKAVGVSGKMIDYAEKVHDHGVPELVKAVDDGRMSVTTAAKLSEEPEQVQREAAAQAAFSGGRYRLPTKKIRQPNTENEPIEGQVQGKGIACANEAINCLIRIPKNDALRKRGFQIVMDWIKANQ